jgi:hypothetical protein
MKSGEICYMQLYGTTVPLNTKGRCYKMSGRNYKFVLFFPLDSSLESFNLFECDMCLYFLEG